MVNWILRNKSHIFKYDIFILEKKHVNLSGNCQIFDLKPNGSEMEALSAKIIKSTESRQQTKCNR